jgi:hypothetical protein
MHHETATVTGSDQRPCVSRREFRGAKRWDRTEIERRWEVKGLGKRLEVAVVGIAMVYPRCGYTTDEAWYGVAYSDGHAMIYAEWKNPEATLHGRP